MSGESDGAGGVSPSLQLTRTIYRGEWAVVGWPFSLFRAHPGAGSRWYLRLAELSECEALGGVDSGRAWMERHRLEGPYRTRRDALNLLADALSRDPLPVVRASPLPLRRLERGQYITRCGRMLITRSEEGGTWKLQPGPGWREARISSLNGLRAETLRSATRFARAQLPHLLPDHPDRVSRPDKVRV